MTKVAIVGAGLIGRAFAMIFARSGWAVALYDPVDGVAAATRATCRDGLHGLAANGLCANPDAAHATITVASTLADALDGASHVQENGPENLAVKADIFAQLDALASPDAVLASSSSALRCSLFTEGLAGRHRCLIAHPVNPPHLIPLIELCGAPWTSPDTIATARATYEAIGQAPITVNREIDGFVLNRLQGALLTEAFKLVSEGVVSPADLDRTVSHGLGRRWAFMGPFQTIELNAPDGVADYCARYSPFYQRFADGQGGGEVWSSPAMDTVIAAWGEAHRAAEHAAHTSWRDGVLADLAGRLDAAAVPPPIERED